MARGAQLWLVKCTGAWARIVLVIPVLSAILVARNIPPTFPTQPSVNSAISASSHHDQRPRFDYDQALWSMPESTFLSVPPTIESARVTQVLQLAFSLKTKGYHYNRPPPLGYLN
jgi:hypothetical protein